MKKISPCSVHSFLTFGIVRVTYYHFVHLYIKALIRLFELSYHSCPQQIYSQPVIAFDLSSSIIFLLNSWKPWRPREALETLDRTCKGYFNGPCISWNNLQLRSSGELFIVLKRIRSSNWNLEVSKIHSSE